MKPVKCHRQATSRNNRVFLTFDDGPEPGATNKVLEVLARHKVHATFFVVTEKAEQYKELFQDILAEGHAIGNHSLNHRFRPFFAGRKTMFDWINSAEQRLQALSGAPSVGWRSPAGIRTPPLHFALKQLNLPLIHWDTRYFDAVTPWTWAKAEKSLGEIKAGSIVLLHDKQKKENQETFLVTLDRFIGALLQRGLRPDRLERADLDPH